MHDGAGRPGAGGRGSRPRAPTSPARELARTPVEDQRVAALAEVVQGDDLEAVRGAELAQRADVAGVADAEPGVLADDDRAGAERLDEHGADELLGGPLGELAGELHDQHRVEAGASAASSRWPGR